MGGEERGGEERGGEGRGGEGRGGEGGEGWEKTDKETSSGPTCHNIDWGKHP